MGNFAGMSGRLIAALVAGAVLVAGVAWYVWPEQPDMGRPTAVDDVSGNYRACLLPVEIDRKGASLAVAAWTGLQRAASTGTINAQQFPVPATDISTATAHLNGAISQRCGVMVTVGRALMPAVRKVAAKSTRQRFLVVGTTLNLPNVDSIAESDPEVVATRINARVLELAAE